MPLIRRDAATVADLQAAKSRRKSIAGTGAVLRRMARRRVFQGHGRAIPADQKSSARIVRRR